MALENEVQDLTSAIRDLIVAITGAKAVIPAGVTPGKSEKATPKSKSSEPTDAPKETLASSPSGAAQETETDAPGISFEALAGEFRKLLSKDREAAVTLLNGTLGLKKLSDVQEADYTTVFNQIQDALK